VGLYVSVTWGGWIAGPRSVLSFRAGPIVCTLSSFSSCSVQPKKTVGTMSPPCASFSGLSPCPRLVYPVVRLSFIFFVSYLTYLTHSFQQAHRPSPASPPSPKPRSPQSSSQPASSTTTKDFEKGLPTRPYSMKLLDGSDHVLFTPTQERRPLYESNHGYGRAI
jgi:hypothetical protein